jgi:hypothetical protein
MIFPLTVISLLIPLMTLTLVVWLVARSSRLRRAAAMRRATETSAAGWLMVPPNPWLLDVAARLYIAGEAREMYAGEYRGRGMCVFDYTYVTSNGKRRQKHVVHLVALNLPAALPPLTLRHDSALRQAFGGGDLQLENGQFNERFRIECPDDRYGSAVMHPRMMECVLRNPGLEWQIAGNALVSWGVGAFAVPDATFVDAGVVGPPPTGGPSPTHLMLSGTAAGEVAALWDGTAVTPMVVGTEPGAASAAKSSYALYNKGKAALAVLAFQLAEKYGVTEALVAQQTRADGGSLKDPTLPDQLRSVAWRWGPEFDELAETLDNAGLEGDAARALREVWTKLT